MILNSRSLLIRIHDLIDGKLDSRHAEQVASEYNLFCEQINSRIRQFTKLIRDGNYYAALDLAQLEPSLTTQIERIRFPRENEWRNYLKQLGIQCFNGFEDGELKRVKEICADRSMRQPAAYRGYRKAILLKDKPEAIQHLRKLHSDFPKDLNAKQELMRLEKEAFENAEKELATLLRTGKEEAIIQKVAELLAQPWLISLDSPAWEKCKYIHDAYAQQKYLNEIVQSLSQVKVIQRVGNWTDAQKLVEKLRKAKDTAVFEELTKPQQSELQTILNWYHQCELENNAELRNREAFQHFLEHISPRSIQDNLRASGRKQIRQFSKNLQQEWGRFQSLVPDLHKNHQDVYSSALATIDSLLHLRTQSGNKRNRIWIALAPFALIIASILFWINHRESQIAADITTAYNAQEINSTRVSLNEWDDFTATFHSKRNPFRHYRAHRQVEEIRNWLNELDTRHSKIEELLERIESALSSTPNRSELRRIQLNLTIVKDLLQKMPQGIDESISARFEQLDAEISRLHATQIQELREELISDLNQLDQLIAQYFPSSKTRFENVASEIREIRDDINQLEGRFRQSFEGEEIADLKERLTAASKKTESFESACTNLIQFEDRLRQSIALSEYLEYLNQISNLPFTQYPLVKQASKLIRYKSEFEHLAQQLLLPDNPVGWEQFTKKMDEPLVAKDSDPKELSAWKNLSGIAPLKDVYRYRLFKYKDGNVVGSFRVIYSRGEVVETSESAQTSGRKVSTLNEFDEPNVGKGVPFKEKVYVCDTDGAGNPINGEILLADRLSPESGFYRQIEQLCGFDPTTQTFKEPLLEVIDSVKTNEFISPIFKTWVIQELFNIMIVRAYDWGLNFCPSAQLEYKNLSAIKGTLFPYDWLRQSTQNRILQPLISFYENQKDLSYYQQALASRELFKQIARQRVRYGGYVNENGLFMLLNGTPNDRKLFGMRLGGPIDILRRPGTEKESPTNFPAEPFSPIMFFNDPPEIILDRVTRNTGVDVNSEAFRPYLPPIFQ